MPEFQKFVLVIDLKHQQKLFSIEGSLSVKSNENTLNNSFSEQLDYLLCGQQLYPAILLDSAGPLDNGHHYQAVIDSLTFSHDLLTSSNKSILSSESTSDLDSLASPSHKSSPSKLEKKTRGAKLHKMRSIESLLDVDKKHEFKEKTIGSTVSPLMTTVSDKPVLLLSSIYLPDIIDDVGLSSSALVTLNVSLYKHVPINLMSSFLKEPRLGAAYIRSLIEKEITQQEHSEKIMTRLELVAKLETSAPIRQLVKQVNMHLERESNKSFLVTFDLIFAHDHLSAKIDKNSCASLFSIDKANIEIKTVVPFASSMHLNQIIFFKKLDDIDNNPGLLRWRCTVVKGTIEDLFSSINLDLNMRLSLQCCYNSSTLNLFYESPFDIRTIFYSTKIEHPTTALYSSFPIQVDLQDIPNEIILNNPFDLDLLLINKSQVTDYTLHLQLLPFQLIRNTNEGSLVDSWIEHVYTSPPPFLPLQSNYYVAKLEHKSCTILTIRFIPMTEGTWYLPPILIQATSSISSSSYSTNTMLPMQELILDKLLKLKTTFQ